MAEQPTEKTLNAATEHEVEARGELTPAEATTSGVGAPPADAHRATPPDAALEPASEAAPEADGPESPGVDHEGATESGEGEEPGEEDIEYVEEKVVVMRRGTFVVLAAAAAVLIIALAAATAYMALKPAAAVARVNGASISRKDYDKAVAVQSGQTALDNLINDKLVAQDAARKHVSVSTDEVDAKLKEVKGQFGSEDEYRQALNARHVTELSLRDSIRQFLLLQKLTADRAQVSDADVQKAYDDAKDTTYQGKSFDEVKPQIQQQLTTQKQQDATSSYLDDLKKNAKITMHIPGA